mmetsp:Transcript_34597/g.57968  ORF Transcript_34597/g.57968 Transcript_34597/m.57968 type:complete len:204 (-) Transcript_34597:248-859(-)|eukprot:CAMPEP_0184336390 /NCGR_PEP_ID=MMETSP1089-20130417/4707_1 /TAXON_ID=38269 ORGANISM="Gloeochaete wittrockiana, Strain SAG46.84" /NCGR_SAMPLE_ID=MMETSP1089 /ASSEMBLY_ACC=CAM_ASM_000445 /LENGTH=203 /DNA_ID=CAMNT_0026661405 /DNA_START=8 /DNA_END=619 /DNA_ORIENTATION=+
MALSSAFLIALLVAISVSFSAASDGRDRLIGTWKGDWYFKGYLNDDGKYICFPEDTGTYTRRVEITGYKEDAKFLMNFTMSEKHIDVSGKKIFLPAVDWPSEIISYQNDEFKYLTYAFGYENCDRLKMFGDYVRTMIAGVYWSTETDGKCPPFVREPFCIGKPFEVSNNAGETYFFQKVKDETDQHDDSVEDPTVPLIDNMLV